MNVLKYKYLVSQNMKHGLSYGMQMDLSKIQNKKCFQIYKKNELKTKRLKYFSSCSNEKLSTQNLFRKKAWHDDWNLQFEWPDQPGNITEKSKNITKKSKTNPESVSTQIQLWGEFFSSWHKSQSSLPNSPEIPVQDVLDFHSILESFKLVLFACSPLQHVLMSWDHIWQMKHANDRKGKYQTI